MKTERPLASYFTPTFWLTIISLAVCVPTRAQVTDTWTGTGGNADWNNPANWDQLIVPGVETNAVINLGSAVTYGSPMTAPSFSSLTLGGSLDINASGFTVDAGTTNPTPFSLGNLAVLNINAQGVMTVLNQTNVNPLNGMLLVNPSGSCTMSNCGTLQLAIGAGLTVTNGILTMTNTAGSASINFGPNGRNNGATGVFDHATVSVDKLLAIQGGASSGSPVSMVTLNGGTLDCLGGCRVLNSTDDTSTRLVVDGGALANLGAFVVQRTGPNGGLVLSNGVVNTTSIQVGTAASRAYVSIFGGTLTNTGLFHINDTTTGAAGSSDRKAQFLIRGGTVVSTGSEGIVIAYQANNGGSVSGNNIGGILDINAGTLTAEGITLIKDATLTNAYARLNLSGTGTIYLGSLGLVGNVGISNTSYVMSLGGTLGANADYSIVGNGTLSGTFTVNAADPANVPHKITNTGVWSGSGALVKTGGGVLTLTANNTYSGTTTVGAGALVLAPSGSISNTTSITVNSGGVLDVSAISGATLLSSQILGGSGTVNGSLTALSGSSIRPGGLLAAGELTFANNLTVAGSVTFTFDLSDDPSNTVKTNDSVKVLGALSLTGTNVISINPLSGTPAPGSVYRLIRYGNSLSGGIGNLTLAGISGVLSNDAVSKAIVLVVQSSSRAPTSVVWLGGLGANTWDTITTSNWLNGAARDIFVTGDNARFDNTGAANAAVTVVGSANPSALVVDTGSNYVFSGSGSIDGTGSLIKTNTGTLTVLTTNGYSGPTIIGAGVVEAVRLAPGGLNSSLGSAGTDAANLQFFDSTLRYLGPSAATDRGATFNGTAAALEVTNPSATLTMSGNLVGAGGLTKGGPGTLILSGSGGYAGPTILSNGTLQINSAVSALGTNALAFAGGTVSFNVSGQPTYPNALNVLTTGGMISAGGNNNIVTGPWSGAGTLNLSIATNGTFTINQDMTTNFTGSIALGNSDGFFRFNAGGNSSGAQQSTGSPTATFDLGTGYATLLNRNGGNTTYYLGGLAGGSNTTVRGSSNSGSPNTYEVGDNNASTAFAGTITNGAGGSAAVVSLLKAGTGTLTLLGTNTYTGTTTISNGVLALSGSGTIASSPTINLLAGAVLKTSARTDGALPLSDGQTLLGEGTVQGSVTVQSNATLSPGPSAGSIGKMVITNALTVQPGGILAMEADHNSATNDVIAGLAHVTYGGTLNLTLYSVDLNSSFKLFNAGSYSGGFDLINPNTPGTGWVWDVSSLTVNGTLKVKTFVFTIPKIANGSLTSTNLTLSGTGGPPFYGYIVYGSPDLLQPRASWPQVGTGNFRGDGSFVFITPIDTNGPPQFYTLQYSAP